MCTIIISLVVQVCKVYKICYIVELLNSIRRIETILVLAAVQIREALNGGGIRAVAGSDVRTIQECKSPSPPTKNFFNPYFLSPIFQFHQPLLIRLYR